MPVILTNEYNTHECTWADMENQIAMNYCDGFIYRNLQQTVFLSVGGQPNSYIRYLPVANIDSPLEEEAETGEITRDSSLQQSGIDNAEPDNDTQDKVALAKAILLVVGAETDLKRDELPEPHQGVDETEVNRMTCYTCEENAHYKCLACDKMICRRCSHWWRQKGPQARRCMSCKQSEVNNSPAYSSTSEEPARFTSHHLFGNSKGYIADDMCRAHTGVGSQGVESTKGVTSAVGSCRTHRPVCIVCQRPEPCTQCHTCGQPCCEDCRVQLQINNKGKFVTVCFCYYCSAAEDGNDVKYLRSIGCGEEADRLEKIHHKFGRWSREQPKEVIPTIDEINETEIQESKLAVVKAFTEFVDDHVKRGTSTEEGKIEGNSSRDACEEVHEDTEVKEVRTPDCEMRVITTAIGSFSVESSGRLPPRVPAKAPLPFLVPAKAPPPCLAVNPQDSSFQELDGIDELYDSIIIPPVEITSSSQERAEASRIQNPMTTDVEDLTEMD